MQEQIILHRITLYVPQERMFAKFEATCTRALKLKCKRKCFIVTVTNLRASRPPKELNSPLPRRSTSQGQRC